MGSSESKSLIGDLAGLSKPMTKFIEVVANGIGIAYEPVQKVLLAKAKSYEIKTLTEATKGVNGKIILKNGDYEIALDNESIEGRSLNTLISREVKKQLNIENIVYKAKELIENKENVSNEEVNQDWITRFFEIAKNVSDDEMQNLWAKILSDEIEKPKSYSLRTLELVKNLSKEEAEFISDVCKLGFLIGESKDVAIIGDKSFLNKKEFLFYHRTLAEEFNIAKFDMNLVIEPSGEECFVYNNKAIAIKIGDKETTIPVVKFTTIGSDVYNLVNKEFDISYVKEVSAFLKGKGVKEIKLIDVYRENDELKKEYKNSIDL